MITSVQWRQWMPGKQMETFMNRVTFLSLQHAPLSWLSSPWLCQLLLFFWSTNQSTTLQGKILGFSSACNWSQTQLGWLLEDKSDLLLGHVFATTNVGSHLKSLQRLATDVKVYFHLTRKTLRLFLPVFTAFTPQKIRKLDWEVRDSRVSFRKL